MQAAHDKSDNSESINRIEGGERYRLGLKLIAERLDLDEVIEWSAEPSKLLVIIDLTYRAALWWTLFPCVIPIFNAELLVATLLIMALLARLDYKRFKQGSVYVLTNKRAFVGRFNHKGELRVEDYPLRNLVKTRKTPFTRTIKMRFKGASGAKLLKFPYVHDPNPAIALLMAEKPS